MINICRRYGVVRRFLVRQQRADICGEADVRLVVLYLQPCMGNNSLQNGRYRNGQCVRAIPPSHNGLCLATLDKIRSCAKLTCSVASKATRHRDTVAKRRFADGTFTCGKRRNRKIDRPCTSFGSEPLDHTVGLVTYCGNGLVRWHVRPTYVIYLEASRAKTLYIVIGFVYKLPIPRYYTVSTNGIAARATEGHRKRWLCMAHFPCIVQCGLHLFLCNGLGTLLEGETKCCTPQVSVSTHRTSSAGIIPKNAPVVR